MSKTSQAKTANDNGMFARHAYVLCYYCNTEKHIVVRERERLPPPVASVTVA